MDKTLTVMTAIAAAAGLVALTAITTAPAQQRGMMEQEMADLSNLPPGQQVAALRYCDNVFHVTTGEGDTIDFPEFNLRFKVDGSDTGPPAGAPALLPAGMMGDRAFVIFSGPAEISAFIEAEC